MQTLTLQHVHTAAPWLEHTSRGGGVERVEITRLPFVIGRSETCDLPVNSSRVSREHAVIQADGARFSIKDLKSTNGTLVNGNRVTEIRLTDGDLLVIADSEFCFRMPGSADCRRTATQVLDRPDTEVEEGSDDVRALLIAARSRQEALLHRAVRVHFRPIVDLTTNQPAAFEVVPRAAACEATAAEQQLAAVENRLSERLQELSRLLAVEQSARFPRGTKIFLPIEPAEIGADGLTATLERLQAIAGPERTLVAAIPDSAVADIAYFRAFVLELRTLGIGIAYTDFAGGPGPLRARKEFAPDFIKPVPALIRGLDRHRERQRQLAELVAAANEIGAQLIAAGLHSEHETAVCRQLGFRLGQGEHLGLPMTLDGQDE